MTETNAALEAIDRLAELAHEADELGADAPFLDKIYFMIGAALVGTKCPHADAATRAFVLTRLDQVNTHAETLIRERRAEIAKEGGK